MSIHSKFKNFKRWYRLIYKHKDKIDLGREIKLPWKTKLKYNMLGFTDQDYVTFDLANNDYHQYISYWERWGLESINGRFGYIIGEKLVFERFFGNIVHVPHIFCWVHDNSFIDPNTGEMVDVISELNKEGRIIAKPTRSKGGGSGIHSASYIDGKYFFDDISIEVGELKTKLISLKDYIFVQFIHQAKYSSSIFSDTANSIRVATGRWKDGHVSLLYAFHRFGGKKTGAVDNINSGGVFAYIDEKGVLSSGRHITNMSDKLVRHPDTDAQIEGVIIPHWEELVEQLLLAHKHVPYYQFLAWDVVIDENGIPFILEINKGSDLEIQSIKPMRNETMGRFMREYSLLSPRID